MPVTTRHTFAEFFAGIGLVRLGLERRGRGRWTCRFANDLDPVKRRMYAAHFRGSAHADHIEPNAIDVHHLAGADVPTVDLATASFPCTDLSVAGGRRGIRQGQSSAFWGFHRVLREMGARRRPRVVLLENVVGLVTSNAGADLRDLLRAMNELGYAADLLTLDARWFVPQSRPRLFIVCARRPPRPPASLGGGSRLRSERITAFIQQHRDDIAWNLLDLPEPPTSSGRTLRDVVADPPAASDDWWSDDRVAYLYHQMFPRHQAWIDQQLNARSYRYATAFRRVRQTADGKRSMAELRTDGVAGCLRTPKGGSGRQILVRAGRGRMRARLLSGPECAALMGADGFTLDGSTLNQALFGFGDAVCTDAIHWLAEHAIEPLLHAMSHDPRTASNDGRSTDGPSHPHNNQVAPTQPLRKAAVGFEPTKA